MKPTEDKGAGFLTRAAIRYLKKRGFEAAKSDRFKLSWLKAGMARQNINDILFKDLETLVARSREQAVNNPYAARFYRLLKTKVIGPKGVTFQNRALLPNGDPDTAINQMIEAAWRQWAKKGTCDVTGHYSLVSLLHLWIETVARDGEVLIREVRGYRNGFGYALQIIETDRIDRNLNQELSNGNIVRMGIEFDKWGREVAAHILKHRPAAGMYQYAPHEHERILATEYIHSMLHHRPEQARGFPWLHASMVDIHHLGEYRESELIAAEISAKNLGFYKQNPDALDDPPAEDSDEGELYEELEPGTAKLLPYGIEYQEGMSQHPHTNFGDFIKNTLRGIASGAGPSYNTLANDGEAVSWSTLRHFEMDDRDYYRLLQGFILEDMERICTHWLEMAMLTGKVAIRPSDFDRVNKPHFQGRGWAWVSPKDEALANEKEIANITNTRAAVIRTKGEDPEEVFAEAVWETELLKSKGLLNTSVKPANNQEDMADDEEDANSDA